MFLLHSCIRRHKMYIKFKEDITVTIRSAEDGFSGDTSFVSEKRFKQGEQLRVGYMYIVGEPNKKIKTRPGQPGGRKTIIRIGLHSDWYWEQFDLPYAVDIDEFHLNWFTIDNNLIEVIKEPQSADN